MLKHKNQGQNVIGNVIIKIIINIWNQWNHFEISEINEITLKSVKSLEIRVISLKSIDFEILYTIFWSVGPLGLTTLNHFNPTYKGNT